MTSPVPGMTYPNPRTWSIGDLITTPRLRGDMGNLANLFTSGRPLLVGDGAAPSVNGVTNIGFNATFANTWNVSVVNSTATISTYPIPLAGWWLLQGNMTVQPPPSTPVQQRYTMGFNVVVNGAASAQFNGGGNASGTGASSNLVTGQCGAELLQLNPFTSDTVQWFAFCSSITSLWSSQMMAEWICLPTSGLTSYSGPYGTVVASPQTPTAFPPGPGTTFTGCSAGATSITVASNTGMVIGGTLGLDYINGQLNLPVAEAVTISSVSGTTIGISATSFAHASGAPVAVPVSAAFLNQQCRDVINFLTYPPIVRATSNATQSIASASFPNGTAITTLGTETVDSFGAFASSTFTAPIGGLYYVYGQVSLVGSTTAFQCSAGVSVAGGTVLWGTTMRVATSGGATIVCPNVVRHLRLTAGQTVTLQVNQNSGGAMLTNNGTSDKSKLIVIWRAV